MKWIENTIPIYNLLYVINSELNKDFCPCYYNTSALSDMAEKKYTTSSLFFVCSLATQKISKTRCKKVVLCTYLVRMYCTISLSLFSVFLWMCLFLSKNRKPRCCFWLQAIYIPGAQPFTSFMAYPLQDI